MVKKKYLVVLFILLNLIILSSHYGYAKTNKWITTGEGLSVTLERPAEQREDSTLNIVVSDIKEPIILIVTLYPEYPEGAMKRQGALPNSFRDKYIIRGKPVVKKILKDGSYQLTFSSEVFRRFLGQRESDFSEWAFDIILASDIFLQFMAPGGGKHLGGSLILGVEDISDNFVMLTSFPESRWAKDFYVKPLPSLINNDYPGFGTAIPNQSIKERLQLLVPR